MLPYFMKFLKHLRGSTIDEKHLTSFKIYTLLLCKLRLQLHLNAYIIIILTPNALQPQNDWLDRLYDTKPRIIFPRRCYPMQLRLHRLFSFTNLCIYCGMKKRQPGDSCDLLGCISIKFVNHRLSVLSCKNVDSTFVVWVICCFLPFFDVGFGAKELL